MKKREFYLVIGIILGIFGFVFVSAFPMNLPFVLVGGALIGYNI